MLEMLSREVPRFLKVEVSSLVDETCTVPKLNRLGVRLMLVPTPVTEMSWGLEGSVSVMVNVPARLPVALGLKVTLMVQVWIFPVPAGGSGAEQVLVWVNSGLLLEMLVMVRVVVPKFETVAVLIALDVPTACGGKVRVLCDAGEQERVARVRVGSGVWLKLKASVMSPIIGFASRS